ncbi:unnamed protein product, partial [marine sediment metagenome]
TSLYDSAAFGFRMYYSNNFVIKDSKFYRKWYLIVNTTDESSTPLQDVNVSTYENTTGSWVLDWYKLTDSSGLVLNEPSIQYLENITGRTYYNLNISVTKPAYESNSTIIYNISTNIQINLTLQSGASDTLPPIVTLISPMNQTTTNLTNITFECDTTDDVLLKNVSVYGNWTGTWHLNMTTAITGTSNSTQFNVTGIVNETYKWNCLVYDDSDNLAFDTSNWTFEVNTSYSPPTGIPEITIIYPSNNSYFNQSSLEFNVSINEEVDWYGLSISGWANQTMTLNGSSTGAN